MSISSNTYDYPTLILTDGTSKIDQTSLNETVSFSSGNNEMAIRWNRFTNNY